MFWLSQDLRKVDIACLEKNSKSAKINIYFHWSIHNNKTK